MRIQSVLVAATLFVGCLGANSSQAFENKITKAKGDAWIGHDSSELLMQLRVDGGRVKIREIEDTGETAYTWTTENAAYTETVVTGGGGGMGGPLNVFANPEVLNVFAQPRAQTVKTKTVDHAATSRCQVTFYANLEGIVSRWEYDGPACMFDIKSPKK